MIRTQEKRKKTGIFFIKISVCILLYTCMSERMQTGGIVYADQKQEEEEREKEGIIILSEPVYRQEDLKAPDNQWEDEDGALYGLKSWSIVEQEEEERREDIKKEVICYGVNNASEIQDTCQISSRDSRTGSPIVTVGKRVRETLLEEWWIEETGITLVCYLNRGDRTFQPETAAVYNAQEPPREVCQKILSEMGISPSDYQLERVVWDGEIFDSPDGFLCRRIKAVGRKKVKDYQVIYEGTAVYPAVTSYYWRAAYVRENREEEEEKEGTEEDTEEINIEQINTEEISTEGTDTEGISTEEKKPLWGEKNNLWAEGKRWVRYLVTRITEIRIPLFFLAAPLILICWMISFWRHKKK